MSNSSSHFGTKNNNNNSTLSITHIYLNLCYKTFHAGSCGNWWHLYPKAEIWNYARWRLCQVSVTIKQQNHNIKKKKYENTICIITVIKAVGLFIH